MRWEGDRQAEGDPFWEKITITGHFYRRERKRMVLCGLGLTAMLAYLVFAAGQSPLLFLVPPAVILLAIGRMVLGGTRKFSREMASLDPFRRERLLRAFQQPHPQCRLWSGEGHLLENCLLCRSGGQLRLIPLEKVRRTRRVEVSRSAGMVKALLLWTETDRCRLEFAGKHREEREQVEEWIARAGGTVGEEQK